MIEISQHSKYNCPFCGKDSVKRTVTGIWNCKACHKTMAGGAYVLNINSIQIYRFFSLPHFISLLHALVRWNKKCAAEYGASLLVILTFSSSEWAKEHADR
ncbi:unnamed protein product [Albugo candida]|uniref:Uncharacterized protein n=1 Tax=Albugo candida TaxID=65357 RepID=A0A024GVL3_9STRA|nr:unnamed protein product [Albugo candida]|eukprot:CCI50418.1 unnamed protein product [Albugo candida]